MLEELELQPFDGKLRRYKISLAATCSKNERQQDGKNSAELQTELTKTTWESSEEGIRQGRNRTIRVTLVMDDDDDDDDDADDNDDFIHNVTYLITYCIDLLTLLTYLLTYCIYLLTYCIYLLTYLLTLLTYLFTYLLTYLLYLLTYLLTYLIRGAESFLRS